MYKWLVGWWGGSGFLLGVAVAASSGWGYALPLLLALLAATAWLLRSRFVKPLVPTVLILFCVAAVLGSSRWEWSELKRLNSATPTPPAHLVEALFVITEEPEDRDTSTVVIARWRTTGQVMRLTAPRHLGVGKGDVVAVTGDVELPPTNLPDTTFNYREYLARRGIFYQVYARKVELVIPAPWWHLGHHLVNFKAATLACLGRFIPEPEISLLGGLLVGAKAGLGVEWSETFRQAGLSHIIVLSGYNMTIVAETIARGLGFLSLGLRGGLSILGIILFALMANSGAATVRAALMAILAIIARLTGRVYEVSFGLLLVAVTMVAYQPRVLFDLGFQLSFVATLGLLYLSPIIEKYFTWLPAWLGLRLIVPATLAAQLAVTPLLLSATQQFSPFALLANALVLPIIPLVMLLGFITLLVSWLPPLAVVCGLLTSWGLSYILWIAEVVAQLPGAVVTPF